jgi:hypothetical protein
VARAQATAGAGRRWLAGAQVRGAREQAAPSERRRLGAGLGGWWPERLGERERTQARSAQEREQAAVAGRKGAARLVRRQRLGAQAARSERRASAG